MDSRATGPYLLNPQCDCADDNGECAMKDEDYIRKAVSLADGWDIAENSAITIPNGGDNWFVDWPTVYLNNWPDDGLQFVADALAAQLVRQVDALSDDHCVAIDTFQVRVFSESGYTNFVSKDLSVNNDRTMNTIKAIVDSGVLE